MVEHEGDGGKRVPREAREAVRGWLAGAEAEAFRRASRMAESLAARGEGEAARLWDSLSELVERVRRGGADLERRVDDGVRSAMGRAGRPIADELAALRARLEAVQRRIEAVARRARDRG